MVSVNIMLITYPTERYRNFYNNNNNNNLEIIITDASEASAPRESRDDQEIRAQCIGPSSTWTLCYKCICKAPETWKEEKNSIVMLSKCKDICSSKKLDDTPCMKVVGSPYAMENPPEW